MNRDLARQVLAALIVGGFFFALFYLFYVVGDRIDPRDILMMMVGGLVTKFGTVVDWSFGGSDGSERKTSIMAEIIARRERRRAYAESEPEKDEYDT